MKALMVDSCDSDGIDAVRVTVKVTLVVMGCAVSTCINENGAFPTTSVGDTVHDSFFDEITGSLHRLSVIGRSPAAAEYRSLLKAEVERRGLVSVGDGSRQYPNASNFRVPGDTNTAYVVFNSTDLTCTASSVVVIKQFGCREVLVVIEIMRALGPLSFRPC